MNQITLEMYYQLHGRQGANETNAIELLRRVNGLLADADAAGIQVPNDQVSGNPCASGHRTPESNARTANAATASTHLTDQGIDVQDAFGSRLLARFCLKNGCAMLQKHDLYMEDPRWTAGSHNTDPWVHLQTRAPGSRRRVYIPYADVKLHPPQSGPLLPEQVV